MSFDNLAQIAGTALAQSEGLGFDHLTVSAARTRLLGVRIAQSVVCRENVLREGDSQAVAGTWEGRSSRFRTQGESAAGLHARIADLRRDVALQSPDKESVLPDCPTGSLVWEVQGDDFLDLYGPETLYPLLDRHLARARRLGLRVTGYLEAQETLAHHFAQGPRGRFDLRSRDHGLTLSLTVDDPHTGAVGAAKRASVRAPAAELDRLVDEALDQALELCRQGAAPGEVAPGDYTVVMHPAAVYDFIHTAQVYGLFDRRKIDEGRTYLSGRHGALRFDPSLRLAHSLDLPLPGGGSYRDLPLNHRLVPGQELALIAGGQIQDLYLTPYWARQLGQQETFQPHAAPPLVLEAAAGGPLRGRHKTLDDLIKDTERGIYVANTWYLRMVAEMEGVITGMTRDGLFEIRDGRLVRPLLNLRWHDNPLRMLRAISGMTDESQLLGLARLSGSGRVPLARMPGLRIEGFHVSSTSRC